MPLQKSGDCALTHLPFIRRCRYGDRRQLATPALAVLVIASKTRKNLHVNARSLDLHAAISIRPPCPASVELRWFLVCRASCLLNRRDYPILQFPCFDIGVVTAAACRAEELSP